MSYSRTEIHVTTHVVEYDSNNNIISSKTYENTDIQYGINSMNSINSINNPNSYSQNSSRSISPELNTPYTQHTILQDHSKDIKDSFNVQIYPTTNIDPNFALYNSQIQKIDQCDEYKCYPYKPKYVYLKGYN